MATNDIDTRSARDAGGTLQDFWEIAVQAMALDGFDQWRLETLLDSLREERTAAWAPRR